jgi:hypothetical protein
MSWPKDSNRQFWLSGKMEASREGEEALKLYLEKNKDFAPPESSGKSSRKSDTLIEVIGAVRTKKQRSALDDVKMLESFDVRSL